MRPLRIAFSAATLATSLLIWLVPGRGLHAVAVGITAALFIGVLVQAARRDV